jgi:hypothetical protein
MSRLAVAAAALALAAAAAFAPSGKVSAAEMLKAAPVSMDAAHAYLLVRLGKRTDDVWNTVSFMPYDPVAEDLRGKGRAKSNRVPKGEDNAALISTKPFIAEEGNIRTYLVVVTPGRWVIASSPTTSYSLGSYQFEAKGGEITDLGTIYIGPENGSSIWPRLAAIHSSPDIERRGYTVADAMLIEPATEGQAAPAVLAALPRHPAAYSPAPRFGNHSGQLINKALPLGGG